MYSCIHLEETAKTVAVTLSTEREMALMTKPQIDEAVAVFHRYGQHTLDEQDAEAAAAEGE